MKKTSYYALLALGFAWMAGSCSKGGGGDTTPPPSETGYGSLAKAYEEVAPKPTKFNLNGTTGGSFYGNSGVRYIFPANAFQTAAGAPVTGYVSMEVLECIKESDMLFAKMLTVSGEQPLISAGCVNIKATSAGAPVYIRPGVSYEVKLPTNTGPGTAGMRVFTGAPTVSVPGSSVIWATTKDTTTRVVYAGDTITMMPDSVGFINCDKFPSADLVTINVFIDGGEAGVLRQPDFFSYYLLEDAMSALPLNSIYKAFTDNMYEGVKVLRMRSHFVVCAVKNGDFYGGILKSIAPVDGRTYTINLTKTKPTTFKESIDALK